MISSTFRVLLPLFVVTCWLGVEPAYSQNRGPGAQNPRSRGVAPPVGGRPVAAPVSRSVRPFPPLPAKHQEYLDKVLKYWEFKSAKIRLYHCRFRRWKYDPTFGPMDQPLEINEGLIKFEDPDKGLYRVEKSWVYRAPRANAENDGKPEPNYVESKAPGEHWVCDGKSVFQFDYNNKKLVERELPPNVQGTRIVDGPLPFLFGAKVDSLKKRFWMRIITPPNVEGEYWIEAFPKTRQDMSSFQKVHIILAENDYLPQGLVLFSPDFRPNKPARTSYTFTKRQVNPINLNLPGWRRDFYRPKLPDKSWEWVKESYNAPAALPQQPPNEAPPAARQTRRGGFPNRR